MFRDSKDTALAILTALAITLFVFVSPALAQAGHPINSVDTSPGTSVPHAMTDPTMDPEKMNSGVIRLPRADADKPSDSQVDKDVDTMKSESHSTHKTPVQAQQKTDKSIFPSKAVDTD